MRGLAQLLLIQATDETPMINFLKTTRRPWIYLLSFLKFMLGSNARPRRRTWFLMVGSLDETCLLEGGFPLDANGE